MKLQNYIKENVITESINDKGILKCCFFAGSPGSGKSYTLKKITDGSIAPRIVNVDKWIEFLGGGYDEDRFERPKVLTKVDVYNFVNSMLPIFQDATSTDTHAVVKRRNILEKIGYDTAIVYVNTPLEVALKRVEDRNKEGKRFVSLDVVRDYHAKAEKIKGFLKHAFKLYIEVSNDHGQLTDDVVVKAYNRVSWFFSSPVENKIGRDIIEIMRENNWKYLTDGIYSDSELNAKISSWYRG